MKRRLHALRIGVTILALVSSGASMVAADVYTVRKGDTLWAIAKRHGVSIYEIKRASGVSANKPLQIGTKLTIPSNAGRRSQMSEAEVEAVLGQDAARRFGPRLARQYAEEALAGENEPKLHQKVVRTALSYRGSRYVRGGTGARGFDCSGFTRYVYRKFGISLPHSSKAQASCGHPVPRSELQPSDLLFFHTRRRGISHVGIYIGENRFIHASTPRRGVVVSSLNERYYAARYRGARRMLPTEPRRIAQKE